MGHQADTPETSTVPRHTRLLRRGSRYYLRAKVPVDLRAAMGKNEIKWSLETSDPTEALQRIKFESAKADRIFEEARRQTNRGNGTLETEGSEQLSRRLRVLSNEHINELARTWLIELEKEQKDWWEREGRSLDSEITTEVLVDLSHQRIAITGEEPDAQILINDGQREVAQFLEAHGYSLDKNDPTYLPLCRALKNARLEHIQRSTDRIEGRPFNCYDPLFADAFAHSAITPKAPKITVRELGDKFIADQARAKKAPKTLFAYGIHVRLLSEILGEETPIDHIDRAQVEKVCDVLDAMPSNATKRYPGMTVHEAIAAAARKGDSSRLAPNSRRNYFFNMFSVFQYGVKTKVLADNPFDDHWFKKRFTPDDDAQKGSETVTFTSEQLKKLFAAPLYRGCVDDERNFAKPGKNVIRRGRFWVPLIGLFHGLRLNEICQLYTQDVRTMEGELVLEVRPFLDDGETHDKRLKNKASTRTVPIHPELLKMGFAEFVEERRKDAESNRLFPELPAARKSGSYADIFSKWFTGFLVSALGEKPRATFHSFRHGWRDALREADVSEERVNKLGGWAHQGQHARYGRAKLIQLLKVEISKVRFQGLDLSHLYVL